MVHMFNHNTVDNIQVCLDIPFIDHPYLIGPRGRKCQHLMDRYRSLIHFPDSNRRPGGPKLNNVLVTGSMKNAEEVRNQLRNRTPIRLAVQFQHFSDAINLVRMMEHAITERSLPIRMSYSEDTGHGMLKTEWRNEDILVKFCDEFLGLQNEIFNNAEIFTVAETVLPLVNPWNAEISHWLIEHVYEMTGCRVFYPPKEKFADQPPSYFIKGGSASGVLRAAKFVTGLTMFQLCFSKPLGFHVNKHMVDEWQKELLVHTTIEPVYKQSNELSHEKVILRSFEFCLNSVYVVRSIILGFKKTVQTPTYDFMSSTKQLIPGNIFSTAQLYFPLYAIDDERSFDWNLSGEDFFKNFYGGPLSPRHHVPHNEDMSARMQKLMKISPPEAFLDNSENENNNASFSSNNLPAKLGKTPDTDITASGNRSKVFSPLVSDGSPLSIEVARAFPPLNNFARSLNCSKIFSPMVSDGSPLSVKIDRAAFPSNESTLEHEDDPELQAIMRRTMPCLEVTKEQLESVDRDAMVRAVMTADNLAMMTDPFHRPFNYAEYSVSYPAQVSVEEFNRQFEEFLLERDRFYQTRTLASHVGSMAGGMVDEEENRGQRKSASF